MSFDGKCLQCGGHLTSVGCIICSVRQQIPEGYAFVTSGDSKTPCNRPCNYEIKFLQIQLAQEKQKREAAEKEVERLEQLVCDFQAAGMIDIGGMNGPCEVKPEHIEKHVTDLREENSYLQAHAKILREALNKIDRNFYHAEFCIYDDDEELSPNCPNCIAIEALSTSPEKLQAIARAESELVEVMREWRDKFADCTCDDPELIGHDSTYCHAYFAFSAALAAYERA